VLRRIELEVLATVERGDTISELAATLDHSESYVTIIPQLVRGLFRVRISTSGLLVRRVVRLYIVHKRSHANIIYVMRR
jgi:DNA-binding CsgD family transcriptional regulator